MPKLILSALQVNIAGGRLPAPENNGRRYLKIPLDALNNPAWDQNRSEAHPAFGASAIPGVNPSSPSQRYLMEMLQQPTTAVLDTHTDLSAEAVDGVTAAPQPASAMTTSTTGSRLPLATWSSNSYKKEASGRLSQRVALIDPKPLTRRSIADLLAKAFPESAVVAASTCDELLAIDERRIGTPILVVAYIRSSGFSSTYVQSALELLRVRLPEALTVVLADREDVAEVNRALAHGVRGYIPTSVECGVAVAALRLISAGGTFVPPDALRATTTKPDDQPEGERLRRSDGPDLTPRELSVIDLLREGKPNKLIGRELEMQESTVKVHVRNILKKLNARNRTHAALVASRLLGKGAEPVALPHFASGN